MAEGVGAKVETQEPPIDRNKSRFQLTTVPNIDEGPLKDVMPEMAKKQKELKRQEEETIQKQRTVEYINRLKQPGVVAVSKGGSTGSGNVISNGSSRK